MPLSEQQKQRIYTASNVDPSQYDIIEDGQGNVGFQTRVQTNPSQGMPTLDATTAQRDQTQTSFLGAAGREALRSVPSAAIGSGAGALTAAGLSSFLAGATGVEAASGVGLPAALVTGAGALLAGGIAAYGARKAQNAAINNLLPQTTAQAYQQQEALDQAQHPYGTLLGGAAANMAGGFNPALGLKGGAGPISALKTLRNMAVGTTRYGTYNASAAELANLGQVGLGAVMPVGQALATGQPLDNRVLAEAALGSVFSKPNRLGQKLYGFHPMPDNLRSGDIRGGTRDTSVPSNVTPPNLRDSTAYNLGTPEDKYEGILPNQATDTSVSSGQHLDMPPEYGDLAETTAEHYDRMKLAAQELQAERARQGALQLQKQVADVKAQNDQLESSIKSPLKTADVVPAVAPEAPITPAPEVKSETQQLFDLGYSAKDIKKLTPADIKGVLKQQIPRNEHPNIVGYQGESQETTPAAEVQGTKPQAKEATVDTLPDQQTHVGQVPNWLINLFNKIGAKMNVKPDYTSGVLRNQYGGRVNGIAYAREGLNEALSKVDLEQVDKRIARKRQQLGNKTDISGADTIPHEVVVHPLVDMLKTSPRAKDRALYTRMLDAVSKSDEYKQYAERNKDNPQKMDAEEYMVQATGEHLVKLAAENGEPNWSQDFKAALRTNWRNPSVSDVAHVLAMKAEHGPSFHQLYGKQLPASVGNLQQSKNQGEEQQRLTEQQMSNLRLKAKLLRDKAIELSSNKVSEPLEQAVNNEFDKHNYYDKVEELAKKATLKAGETPKEGEGWSREDDIYYALHNIFKPYDMENANLNEALGGTPVSESVQRIWGKYKRDFPEESSELERIYRSVMNTESFKRLSAHNDYIHELLSQADTTRNKLPFSRQYFQGEEQFREGSGEEWKEGEGANNLDKDQEGSEFLSTHDITERTKGATKIAREFDQKPHRNQEENQQRDFVLSSPSELGKLYPSQAGRNTEYDTQQLIGQLRNRHTSEINALEQLGVFKDLPARITPAKLIEHISNNGPQLQVHSYGMDRPQSKAKQELDKLTHEWVEPHHVRSSVGNRISWKEEGGNVIAWYRKDTLEPSGHSKQLPPEEKIKMRKYLDLLNTVNSEPQDTSPVATSHYKQVSPKDTTKYPVKRVDVVLPRKKLSYEEWLRQNHNAKDTPEHRSQWYDIAQQSSDNSSFAHEPTKWQQDNLHENLPNTLGWAAIQYEPHPTIKGGKIAHIYEAQSRIAQETRNRIEAFKKGEIELSSAFNPINQSERNRNDNVIRVRHAGEIYDYSLNDLKKAGLEYKGEMTNAKVIEWLRENSRQISESYTNFDKFPQDYNRLILKAALKQALKDGATHIAISDAPTAMMTERHDLQSNRVHPYDGNVNIGDYILTDDKGNMFPFPTKQEAFKAQSFYQTETSVRKANEKDVELSRQYKVEQEQGMRLNYDKVLPSALEDLTGHKGELLSLGKHKNAFKPKSETVSEAMQRSRDNRPVEVSPRDNLIFKNSDGTPKTDVTARVYPLDAIKNRFENTGDSSFTLFNKKYQGEGQERQQMAEKPDMFLKLFGSATDKIRLQGGPTAKYVGDKLDKWGLVNSLMLGKYRNRVQDIVMASPSKEASARIDRYGREMMNFGSSGVTLNEQEKAVYDGLRKYLVQVADENVHREIKKNPNYWPGILSTEVAHEWSTNPNSAEAKGYKKDWMEHALAQKDETNYSREDLEKILQDYVDAIGGKAESTNMFGALRKAEGIGLPISMQDNNLLSRFSRYGTRVARDLAYNQVLESDPRMRYALRIQDEFGKKPTLKTQPTLEDGKTLVDDMSGDESVKNAMKFVNNDFSEIHQPKLKAATRLVSSGLLGAATAVRNIAQILPNTLPYIKPSEYHNYVKALSNFQESWKDAFNYNARQHNLNDLEFGSAATPDGWANTFNNVADQLRKWQGRNLSEGVERSYEFGLGKLLALSNVGKAARGDVSAKGWLKKFGGGVEGLEGKIGKTAEAFSHDDLNRMAKAFVDRVSGTYDIRGLPAGAMEGQLAPFMALSRWSLEKTNVIYKDVIQPAIQHGEYAPLLTYTLGTILTGAGIKELNKLMSGKESNEPTLKEATTSGDMGDQARAVLSLMQLSSFGGLISDVMKGSVDLTKGRVPSGLSYPLADFVSDTLGKNLANYFAAINQGEDKFNTSLSLVENIVRDSVQSVRLAANHTWMQDEVEKGQKYRDLRVFNELVGNKAPEAQPTEANPYIGREEKAFKNEMDVNKVGPELQQLLAHYFQQYSGNPELLMRKLSSLKQNSYQTIPNPDEMPLTFLRYLDHLKSVKGPEEAQRIFVDYIMHTAMNQAKGEMVPSL